ncbi:FxSxx-COOH system tetratricopeptide repeat protein [Parafrankia discariae]|uniref:FxSxx-COOH system tetratricopeptide repeat protein n=1 Tax=Parafrankia discariae TaxID=365528 RepID=UPI001E5FA620|nr:FxSxx-COOH system tetratricopeptide repeat protein [Parafrankia discariae]
MSYTGADEAWATWVAEVLEAEGWSVVVQAWDSPAGVNFVTWISDQMDAATRTLALCSEAYFASHWCTQEWTGALAGNKLTPLRITDCTIPTVLSTISYRNLYGVDEVVARRRLVEAVGLTVPDRVSGGFPGGRTVAVPAPVRAVFPGRLPAVWNVPGRNQLFTGRQTQLEQIRTGLASGPVAVRGMGGVGKTQLVIEYAHRHAASYSLVWWVDAEQTALLAEKIAALAGPLGLPSDGPVADTAVAVLAALGRREGWLLVFDNADDPTALRAWLPAGPGHVLITSRTPAWDVWAATIEVDLLPRAESIDLLTRRLPGLDPVVADRLADELGDLALALAQAGGYLTRTRLPPADYLTRFRTRRQTFLGKGDDPLYAGRVDTCWSMSLDRLTVDAPAAVQLLELCALLAPEPIPVTLFTGQPALFAPPLGDIAAGADLTGDLDDTIAAVLDYSLARRTGDSLVVHRLVQAVIAGQLTPTRRAQLTDTAVRLLTAASPDSPLDPASWPVWAALGPHLLHAYTRLGGADDPHRLRYATDGFCFHLYARGDYPAAHTLATYLYQQNTGLLGDDHPDTLTSAYTLAVALFARGDAQGARMLNEDTLTRRRRVLGDDHPDTFRSANGLAVVLAALGDAQGALAMKVGVGTVRRWEWGPAVQAGWVVSVGVGTGVGGRPFGLVRARVWARR